MSTEIDYYELLEVERGADDATIKSAYRKLAMKYHPDKNGGCKENEAKFKAVNAAYDCLKDPQKRAAYDRFGHAAFQQGGGGGGQDFSGFSDIFESVFGEFMGGRQGGQRAARRGADLREDVRHVRGARQGPRTTGLFRGRAHLSGVPRRGRSDCRPLSRLPRRGTRRKDQAADRQYPRRGR